MNITTAIILDTRREKKSGKYPVKLRVTFHRKQMFYPYGSKYDLAKNEFEEVFNPKAKGDKKIIQDDLIKERNNADEIIKNLGRRFSFPLFEKEFTVKKAKTKNLFQLIKERASELRENGQISTAIVAECALSSLKKYFDREQFDIEELDVKTLEKYEKWMYAKDSSPTTVGMYIRSIQTVYFEAIESGIVAKELSPFGKGKDKYTIPTSSNKKKALRHDEIGRIYHCETESVEEERAKDFWIFIYLANGINVKDIVLMKFKNVREDRIIIDRAKTKNQTKDDPRQIEIVLTDDLRRIINKWGNKSVFQGSYVFPFLSGNPTPEEVKRTTYNTYKTINKYMKRIQKRLGINQKLLTYAARHSFATIIKNSGRSIEFISEALGHSSIKTTQRYLGSFESEAKEAAAAILTNFPTAKIKQKVS